ncbi:L-rhamnose mutarotase [Enterococcus hulanensis]|uniref:L-rhamnose mutarotase n=1 Tax=Enterococcus hulanensis TaxID=2559929 RepID=UPI0010F72A16|nr:L-rhamnose mutarotase [Enterococcus hulanensis]
MIKKAVRMKPYPGLKEEYAKRHNELWPEMKKMLKDHGAKSYSIFFDPETNYLFGYLEIEDEERWAQTADTEINRKWWDFMADVMETNPDNSPVTVDLEQVFEL